MASIVDSPDIGRSLAVLRGQAPSGRVFSARGKEYRDDNVRTLYLLPDDVKGHRFDDGACLGCGVPVRASFNLKPCASASMPLLEHDIDPITGNCTQCFARQEEIEDNLVDRNVCRCAGEKRVALVPDRSVAAAMLGLCADMAKYLGRHFVMSDTDEPALPNLTPKIDTGVITAEYVFERGRVGGMGRRAPISTFDELLPPEAAATVRHAPSCPCSRCKALRRSGLTRLKSGSGDVHDAGCRCYYCTDDGA